MLKLLQSTPRPPNARIKLSPLANFYTDFSGAEGADLARIEAAQRTVVAQTGAKGARYDELLAEQEALNRELSELTAATAAAQAAAAGGGGGGDGAGASGGGGGAPGSASDMVLSP
ncbi:hypothetical protein BU14_1942s0002 [Porphyra umbilicalis]|uniref:Uncharacterized protein n=1 Tax=Porphyra umbilicalis TaxID=2786 RepID=A0A1X6NKD5_PORUM|nr:hypothetical protein BU14_1942s0002 [Porphyra umbilicalis]|eukprot:OSX69032.1 hypothetical protein BU14_1942s0002 [Porphyra umbilicalis]